MIALKRLNFCFRLFLVFSLLSGNSFVFAAKDGNNLTPYSGESESVHAIDPSKLRVYTESTYTNVLELLEANSKITKLEVEALRDILEEQQIVIKDKRSLLRFLKRFKQELKSSLQSEMPLLGHNEVLSPKTLDPIITKILDTYESEYDFKIKRSHRKSIHYFDQVLSNSKSSKEDTKLFRKSLSAIGLPSHAYSEPFVNEAIFQIKRAKENAKENTVSYPTDKTLYEASQKAKNFFDKQHYTRLQQQTQFTNILKGFPAQLIVFQAAIGATIFSKYFYDSYAYDAHTNPEPMYNFMDTLTPSAAFSFFVFITTSQYTQLGMYKLGMKWDSKILKASAPQAGLAFGFFASAIFDEVLHDVDLHACVKEIMTPEQKTQTQAATQGVQAYQDIAETTPCEKSYMEWAENKWKDYAVDLGLLLGASGISHKIIKTLTLLVRSHSAGEALLTRAVLTVPRVAYGAAFFISIYTFMEVYRALDLNIGRRVKQKWALNDIWSNASYLIQNLNSFSWNQHDEFQFKRILKNIKSLGHRFSRWPKVHGLEYEAAFYQWNLKTNKILTSYGLTHALLNQMYDKSQESLLDSFNVYNPEDDDLTFNGVKMKNIIGLSNYVNYKQLQGAERVEYIGSSCKSLKQDNWLDGSISNWKSVCEDPEKELESNLPLVLDAKKIIVYDLKKLNRNKNIKLNPIQDYLSNNSNELLKPFSLDHHNLKQRLKLAEILLSGDIDSSVYSVHLKEEAKAVATKLICQEFEKQNPEDECLVRENYLNKAAHFLLLQKTTLAGFSLLKKTMPALFELVQFKEESPQVLRISHTLKAFNPYSKGLGIFEKMEEDIMQTSETASVKTLIKQKLSIYFLVNHLVCGSNTSYLEEYFSPPKIFKGFESVCSSSKAWILDVLSDAYGHTLFKQKFHNSILINGKAYEGLYIALEEYIRNNFKTKKEFIEFFVSESQAEINNYSEDIVTSLKNVTNNFMIPGLVNSDPNIISKQKCTDILSHYKKLKSEDFKGLEISLFQIRFWADKLKEVKDLEGGDFDEEVYNSNYCQSLELLKSYHDNFITGTQTVTTTLDETNKIVFTGVIDPNTNMFQALQEKYEGQNIFVNEKIVFYSFLQKTYPDWMISIYLQRDGDALENATQVQKIGYAIAKELEKSINRYFEYLSLLRMQEGFHQGLTQVPQQSSSDLGL